MLSTPTPSKSLLSVSHLVVEMGLSGATTSTRGMAGAWLSQSMLSSDCDLGGICSQSRGSIDRLTRSLVDFSKMVEIFDQANASFVSIKRYRYYVSNRLVRACKDERGRPPSFRPWNAVNSHRSETPADRLGGGSISPRL